MTSTTVPPYFEGPEKRLKIDFFSGIDLRKLPREHIDTILTAAKCTIVSVSRNSCFDAYVLSESSLFVYPQTILLKTCGTTGLLGCLPTLLKLTSRLGAHVKFVQYSRATLSKPKLQPFPHQSFSSEVSYLNKFFNGVAVILGAIGGPRWHVYTANLAQSRGSHSPDSHHQPTLEMIMFDLHPRSMSTFWAEQALAEEPSSDSEASSSSDSEGEPSSSSDSDPEPSLSSETSTSELLRLGRVATRMAGIDTLIPALHIDGLMFDPCGYSCNALSLSKETKDPLRETYFTIHVTPQDTCSFVSFETNAPASLYNQLVPRVLDVFKPNKCLVCVWAGDSHEIKMNWNFPGYNSNGLTQHAVPGSFRATCSQLICAVDGDKKKDDMSPLSPLRHHLVSSS